MLVSFDSSIVRLNNKKLIKFKYLVSNKTIWAYQT